MEHLLSQNKQLISHLEKLMVQLQQLTTQQQQQQQQKQQPTPPKSSTPVQDIQLSTNPPVAEISIPSPRGASPIQSSTPPDNEEVAALVPTMTSTPSPTPAQTSSSPVNEQEPPPASNLEGKESPFGLAAATGQDETDIKFGNGDLGALGSLDIDIALLTTSDLPDDPFAPLTNTSNSPEVPSS